MDWLFNNPLANMYGPHFLLLYATLIGAVMIGCRLALNQSDPTRTKLPPPIPQSPDPYEIAYLRGGPNELARLVLFDLVRMGYATVSDQAIRRKHDHPPEAQLNELQQAVFERIVTRKKPGELFRVGNLPAVVRHFTSDYELALRREQLIAAPDARSRSLIIWGIGASLIGGLGLYKLSAALERNRFNVGFLIAMAIVSLIVLYVLCRPRRLSARGRRYLERLQAAFRTLRARAQGVDRKNLAADPSTLLLVGLFGVPALAGTPFAEYHRTFARSAPQGGSSCGGGCSSGCGSSVGGGGCSGGSSCGGGGGGCGGGGCGGCGGGGS